MRKLTLLALSLLLTFLAFVPVPKESVTVVMEAESYATLEAPMHEVRDATGASGNAYVGLPSGSGQGWRGEGSGSITYRVDLPRAGAYRLWGRVLWKDGCTNAFFLSANEAPSVVFGNDAVFGQWHWVKGQVLSLREGVNRIAFANHSDGTALDKLILTSDPLYLPEGLGLGITRFFDGFAGCDVDNTGSWELLSGNWRVIRSVGQRAGVNNCLAQWAPGGGLALGGFRIWKDYDARVKVMLSGPGSAGLIAYRTDAGNELRLVLDAGEEIAALRLTQTMSGIAKVLGEADAPRFHFDTWHELRLQYRSGGLICALDGRPTITVPMPDGQTGRIGLVTANAGGVYFDNVDVQFRER